MRSFLGSVVVAVATVAAFVLFLGRDHTYSLDPVTGNETGPWSTAQVAGCLAVLLVVLVAAVLLRVPPRIAAAAMPVAFVVGGRVPAAATDESGLYVVGAVLI